MNGRAIDRIAGAWILAVCAASGIVIAGDIYVDASNVSGVEDGSAAHPYLTIQQGILAAVAGDKVLVAAGTYKETVLMGDGVSVIGAGWRQTVIDARDLEDSAVIFAGTRLSPLLTGFTITGGQGDQRSQIGEQPVTFGGGILILDASPTILGNRIVANTVNEGFCLGGGLYVSAQNESPVIRQNIIEDNVAESNAPETDSRGGAIFVTVKDGSTTIEQNLIRSNRSVEGGAIVVDNQSNGVVVIRRNTFVGNRGTRGGALWLTDSTDSTTRVVNNLFVDNGSDQPDARGGGIRAISSDSGFFEIINNTFATNVLTQGQGGGLSLDDSLSSSTDALVANNIFYRNGATLGGGIDHTNFGGTIRSNALFENSGGDLHDAGGSTATLIDNVIADPGFMGTQQNPYRLASDSLLLDGAADDVAPTEDLEGLIRPVEGNGDSVARSDHGASEFPARRIEGMRFVSATHFEWDVELATEEYHVYRGALTRLADTGVYTQDPSLEPLAARFCNVLQAELPFEDTSFPPAGETLFYLVTLVIDGYEGSLGTAGDGYDRPRALGCP